MAFPDPIRNTYEEFPDELEDLLERGMHGKGQAPSSRAPRDTLLRFHEWHLKFLTEQAMTEEVGAPPSIPTVKSVNVKSET